MSVNQILAIECRVEGEDEDLRLEDVRQSRTAMKLMKIIIICEIANLDRFYNSFYYSSFHNYIMVVLKALIKLVRHSTVREHDSDRLVSYK